jgi:cell volume regulation protein A
MIDEPSATALILLTFGVLLATAILFSRVSERVGVPVLLIFIIIGILAGSEGIGGIVFEDYGFAFRVGTVALALILFDGGLNTSLSGLRAVFAPAAVLATVGVMGVAGLVAGAAHFLGYSAGPALLLGAVVSSTDAAAVFAVLRASGLNLKRRVGTTLEVESGANDPMAVILTMAFTASIVSGEGVPAVAPLLAEVATQLVIGMIVGIGAGYGGRALINRLRLPAGGLYPILTIAFACLAFGIATLGAGSGFLAVYVAGAVLGDGDLPYRRSLVRVHDAIAWMGQIVMFLLLGLLVSPSRLMDAAWPGLTIGLFLAFFARPLVVAICLAPFRFPWRETVYVGWVGLRGAVPIILASFPILAGAAGAERMFDVVFFIVVVGALLPGSTVSWATRSLKLESREPPPPQAVLEIESMQPLEGELMSFYIDDALPVTGVPMADLPFPEGSAATLIVRGQQLIAPRGATELVPGDHVFVFARPEDRPFIQLLFGRPTE